ncbi:MAG TPA: twin-arginine translocase subunit TatC [Verrucomicrobiae bacterium]|jgi:sec-independent protein translocase protein TatC|nr:twin-arginine translocase subunit TatC [Verrucomicrobiae bacterium]
MAEPSDELQPNEDEVEGGAVKSFLEHLEDLRWMLIKSSAATLLTMMVCLFGMNRLVAILNWPLGRAQQRHIAFLPEITNQMVSVQLGSLTLQTVTAKSNHLGFIDLGTNQRVILRLDPVRVGTNTLLAVSLGSNEVSSEATGPKLVFMDPSGPFISSLHIAFFGGLILASPFVLYFIGEFVMPALKMIEKKYFLRAFWFGTVLFLSGLSFAYFLVMPAALKFAELYANWMGVDVPYWQAESYWSFELKFMFGMGAGFELPVVLLALVKIGLLNYAKLKAMRRYMIVINLILGALLTTPEVFTQVCMAIALQVLFEIAVWITWYWERQEAKKAAINV